MGVTKKIGFEEDINNIAEVFKALGHPARLQIMNILLRRENCSCGNIVNDLPLAQSTVSNHLLELKKASLIDINFSGKSSIYSVKKDKLNVLNQFINLLIDTPETTKIKKKNPHKTISIAEVNENSNKIIVKKKKSSSDLKQYNYVFKHKKSNS